MVGIVAAGLLLGWYCSSINLAMFLYLKEESDVGSETVQISAHPLCLSFKVLCGLAVGNMLSCVKSLLQGLTVSCEGFFGCLRK